MTEKGELKPTSKIYLDESTAWIIKKAALQGDNELKTGLEYLGLSLGQFAGGIQFRMVGFGGHSIAAI